MIINEMIKQAVSNPIKINCYTMVICPLCGLHHLRMDLRSKAKKVRFLGPFGSNLKCGEYKQGFGNLGYDEEFEKPKYFMSIPKIYSLQQKGINILAFWDFLEKIQYKKTNPTFKELNDLIIQFNNK